jgi:hypothetical protein
MKPLRPFILIIFLFLAMHSIAQTSADLRKSVDGFVAAMTAATDDRETYIRNLRPYIDPAANVDSLLDSYYEHWRANHEMKSYPITTEIKSLTYGTDGLTGKVLIENLWHLGDGKKAVFLSTTSWVKKNDQWYRSGEKAQMKMKKKKSTGK